MKFEQTGLILNTENYAACRDFYGKVLGLPLLNQMGEGADEIAVFALGTSYLMVEHGGTAGLPAKPAQTCPTKFRFNVKNVDACAQVLRDKGVAVEVRQHSWGTTGEFFDPDGNRCALRSLEGFGS